MDDGERPQFPEEVARSGHKNRKGELCLGNDSDEITDKQM